MKAVDLLCQQLTRIVPQPTVTVPTPVCLLHCSINIDIEGNFGTVTAGAITALTRRLAAAVRVSNPMAQVSFDLSFNAYLPAYQPYYDAVGLAAATDFLVPMAYDMDWGGSRAIGAGGRSCPC